jgi:hypothetical protein
MNFIINSSATGSTPYNVRLPLRQVRNTSRQPLGEALITATRGGCTRELLESLELPAETAESLAHLGIGNLGVTNSTWSNYRTAKSMIFKCETETNFKLDIPFD